MKLLQFSLLVTIAAEFDPDLQVVNITVIDDPPERIPPPLRRLEELNQQVEQHLTDWFT